MAVASTVVFAWRYPVEFTRAPKSCVNDPVSNVGAAVVPVYIAGANVAVPNPSMHVATVVPLKQIPNPPPFVGLKKRMNVGKIATGEPSSV